MTRTEQLALEILKKITSDDCVQFGDQRVLMEALNTVVSLGDTNGKGTLQILYTQMNRMFKTLKNEGFPSSDPLAPGSAFSKELEHLIDSATRISSDIVTQFNRLVEECTSTCLRKARKEFQKNGQAAPVQLDTHDAQCFVYRAGPASPSQFTPSVADANPDSFLKGLSTMGQIPLRPDGKWDVKRNDALRQGASKISVSALANRGIYAYYNRVGDDHVSLIPGSIHNPGELNKWAYLPNNVYDEIKNWLQEEIKAKPVEQISNLLNEKNGRKNTMLAWFNAYIHNKNIFPNKTQNFPKINPIRPDLGWNNFDWRNNASRYIYLNQLIDGYTSSVEKSVVERLSSP